MSVFGKEFDKNWPLIDFDKNLSKYGRKLLQKCLFIEKPVDSVVEIDEFIRKSSDFPIEFPIETCRVKCQPKDRHAIIQQQIVSAYPIIHEKVLFLIIDFLEHKLKYGTSRERKLYKNMTISEFVQRLLTKRCISFVGTDDDYLLIRGETGFGPKYLKVGSKEERDPLILKNVLSYDEVKISALLSVSSYSDFINNGNRDNKGIIEKDLTKIERDGIVVGIMGARFERKELMDFQDITITTDQNTREKGYGSETVKNTKSKSIWTPLKKIDKLKRLQDYRRIWNKFYEEQDHLYENVTKDDVRFADSLNCLVIFDNLMMKKRYAISFDLLLLEAEKRAKEAQKLAYVHVVGFGLGVWRAASQQDKIFMETFHQRLKYLLPFLNNIGVVHLSWFNLKEWADLKNDGFLQSKYHPRGGIKTLISNRNPNDKLPSPDYDNMLLIVSYAWDGNAMPGNEFWTRNLTGSNDPSTACSTLITELHNPHINTNYVNGNNLYIASCESGILHIKDYVQQTLENK